MTPRLDLGCSVEIDARLVGFYRGARCMNRPSVHRRGAPTSSSPARTTSPNRPFCTTRLLLETERNFDTSRAFTVANDAEMVNDDIARTPSETSQCVDDADAIRLSGRAVRASLLPSFLASFLSRPGVGTASHYPSSSPSRKPGKRKQDVSEPPPACCECISFNSIHVVAPHRDSDPWSRTRDRGVGVELR